MRFTSLVLTFFFFAVCQQPLHASDSCQLRLRASFAAISSCQRQDIGLTNTSLYPKGRTTFTWETGDGRQLTGFQPSISYPNGGRNYTIRLIAAENNSVCKDTSQLMVRIFPEPDSRFGCYKTSNGNQNYRVFTAYNCNPVECTFHWYLPGWDSIRVTGSNCLVVPDTFSPKKAYVRLMVTRFDGCTSTSVRDLDLLGLDPPGLASLRIRQTENGSFEVVNVPATCQLQIIAVNGHSLYQASMTAGDQRIDLQAHGLLCFIFRYTDGRQQSIKYLAP